MLIIYRHYNRLTALVYGALSKGRKTHPDVDFSGRVPSSLHRPKVSSLNYNMEKTQFR